MTSDTHVRSSGQPPRQAGRILLAVLTILAAMQTAVAADASAAPQAVDGIDLPTAVRAMRSSHPSIRQAGFLVEQRESEERALQADRWPVVEYSLRPGFDPESNRDANLQMNLSLQVPVYDFGMGRAHRSAAEQRTVRFRHLAVDSEERAAAELSGEFFEHAMWSSAGEVAGQHLETLEDVRHKIEMRVSAGLADVSDLQRAEVSIQRAQLQQQQVIARRAMAADRIRLLVGRDVQPVGSLEDGERRLQADVSLAAVDDSPSVAAAEAEWRAARHDVEAARAARFPAISVGVAHNSYFLPDGTDGRSGSEIVNSTQYGVFLSGRMSLGGGARHRVQAARAASLAAQSSYDTEIMRQRLAMRALSNEMEDARARAGSAAQQVALLERARNLYWQEYMLSKRRLTEVFEIERDIYMARVDQLRARADLLRVKAEQLGIRGRLVDTLLSPGSTRMDP